MNTDLVLEDINTGQAHVLSIKEDVYKFGRAITNHFVSTSALVSRQHCIFFRTRAGLAVLDIQSGNGVYINGVRQRAEVMASLNLNDIIGLGCSDTSTITNGEDPTSRTVLRLKKLDNLANPEPQPRKNMSLDETCRRSAEHNKRKISRDSLEARGGPLKIPKLETKCMVVPDLIDIADDDSPDEEAVLIKTKEQEEDIQMKDVHVAPEKLPETKIEVITSPLRPPSTTIEAERPSSISSITSGSSNKSTNSNNFIELSRNIEEQTDSAQMETSNCHEYTTELHPDAIIQQEFKYEPELDIVDDDESFYASIDHVIDPEPSPIIPTPIKIKPIKREPTTGYSQYDVVELSDDEDGVFPASQLFGDEPETTAIPGNPSVDDYSNSNPDDELKLDIRSFNDENRTEVDYPELIVLSDSDDDGDNPWYDRLLRSQLLNESRESMNQSSEIKTEPSDDDLFQEIQTDNALAQEGEFTVADPAKEIHDHFVPSIPTKETVTKIATNPTPVPFVSDVPVVETTKPKEHENVELKRRDTVVDSEKSKSHSEKRKSENRSFRDTEKATEKNRHETKKTSTSHSRKKERSNSRKEVKSSSTKSSGKDINGNKSSDERTKRKSIDGKDVKINEAVTSDKDVDRNKASERRPKEKTMAQSETSKKIESNDSESLLTVGNNKQQATWRSQIKEAMNEKSESSKKVDSIGVNKDIGERKYNNPIPIIVLKKLNGLRRSLQLVDPPFHIKGDGRSFSCHIKQIDRRSSNERKSPSKEQTAQNDTADDSKKDETVTEQHKENTHRKRRRKSEISSKHSRENHSTPMSREERDEIRVGRKEKLKKLADEAKKNAEADASSVKRSNKPKAKVTAKTRNDFLLDEVDNKTATDRPAKTEQESKQEKKAHTTKTVDKLKPAKDTTNSVAQTNYNNPCSVLGEQKTTSDQSRTATTKSSSEPTPLSDFRTNCNDQGLHKENRLPKDNFLPNNTEKSTPGKKKKHVSFNDLNNRVEFYVIDPGNHMDKKCTTKDTMLPQHRPKRNATKSSTCPKLENFLDRILHWNPVWLQEQQTLGTIPPVVEEKKLVPLLSKYNTYEDYYTIAEPLLALELWQSLTKDNNIREKHKRHLVTSIVSNSISTGRETSLDVCMPTVNLEVVVSLRDVQSQAHPTYGDLIFFEYRCNKKGSSAVTNWMAFGYVTKVHQRVITEYTQFNRALLRFVPEHHTLLTYTVMTRTLDPECIQTNRVTRLSSGFNLRLNLRMIQALQSLPVSPLVNQILNPKVDEYQLPIVTNLGNYPLVTNDKLNPKQLEAVARITEAVVQKQAKICLIQGPPGTGKSKVIVNLVTQILYGADRHHTKKATRILLCAPSNAAIDEIVLRLLKIRQTFKQGNRFKMVRVGRTETMHPLVKHISLTELARKDVKRITDNCLSPNCRSQDVEDDKHFLEAAINALQLQLTSPRNLDPVKLNALVRKLNDMKARRDLLMDPRPAERLDPRELSKLQTGAEHGLLKGADIIACTISSCYNSQMEFIFDGVEASISACIVDEATQSVETETLIPLMLGVRTLVLVGDTNQLPPTILSQKAKEFGLDQSLFARIQRVFEGQTNNPIIQLDTQYRMLHAIESWPNRYFYAGMLKNAVHVPKLPFHFYKVINLDSIQDTDKSSNTEEAGFVANVVYTMMVRSRINVHSLPVKVGIITPYNNQKVLVTQKIKERIDHLPTKVTKRFLCEVNTVDSFQGRERDVIIISCVRSSGIGFLADRQRLCVALTRAKQSLIVCGNFKTFVEDPMWESLLTDAHTRGAFADIKSTAEPDEIKSYVFRK